MSPDSTRAPFTDTEQAYYNQLDEDVTAGRIPAVGRGTRRDGSRISDTDLDAILRGRPGLGQSHATGRGRSPRRQVRLPEHTNAALDAYIEKHGTTASAVIRDAVEAYLSHEKRQPHDDRSEPRTHCCPVVMPRIHEQAPVAGGDGGSGVVPRTGFEPATFCSGGRRSIH